MNPVLLTIDLQKDFPRLFPLLKPPAKFDASVRRLTSFFRERKLPIIHLLTLHKEDRSTWTRQMKRDDFRICVEGTEGMGELESVGRRPDETVIHKTRWSAFHGTELDRLLAVRGLDTLVLAGFLTHACIRVTALDAYQRDYDVIIARDCVDTYDAAHERVTLAYLSRYVARVLSNEELFSLLES
ncbi:MAG: isochorismatase family cysteine hydrolase [Chlamydiota bacterium]